MRTKLFLTSLFFMFFVKTEAQEQVIYEDDNFSDALKWDKYDLDGDGYDWNFGPSNSNPNAVSFGFNGMVAFSASYLAPPTEGAEPVVLHPDNLLVSPAIAIPAEAKNVILSYRSGSIDIGYFLEKLSVYAVRDISFSNLKTDTEVQDFLDAEAPLFSTVLDSANSTIRTIPLDGFTDDSVRIVFRHHDSSDQNVIVISEVQVIQGRLGINRELGAQFTVFPNPTSGIVNIANSANITVNKLDIRDINGRKVRSFEFNFEGELAVDISELQAGIYFINISTDQGLLTKKIIKK